MTTSDIEVLGVEQMTCPARARHCTPEDHSRRTTMIGVSWFGRSHRASNASVEENPFLHVEALNGHRDIKSGYTLSRDRVRFGVEQQDLEQFQVVRLARSVDRLDFDPVPVTIRVGDGPERSGNALFDISVSKIYLELPKASQSGIAAPPVAGPSIVPTLAFDTTYCFKIFADALVSSPGVVMVQPKASGRVFTNTCVRLRNRLSYLFDGQNGNVGFQIRSDPLRPRSPASCEGGRGYSWRCCRRQSVRLFPQIKDLRRAPAVGRG
ncbi:MAG: hypothetical protein ACRYFY_05090 [Janthinobacterium lividum]